MLSIRRVFFYLFVLIYLVCCPILILYALGYIVSPDQKQPIVKSGLIYLSTTPPGASVYLGNRKFFRKTPVVLSELVAGNYEVKVALKKYKPWTKTVPVESGKATVLERILLFPDHWKPESLSTEAFQDVVVVSGSRYLILTKNDHADGLFIYDRQLEELQKVFSDYSPLAKSRIMKYFFTERSPSFIVQLDTEDGEKYFWASPRRKEVRLKDITASFSDKPEQIEWDRSEPEKIFSLQNGSVDALNVRTKQTAPKLLSGVRGFGIHDKKMYVLKDDFTLQRLNLKAETEKTLFDDSILGKKLFGKELYQIKILSDDIILFMGEDGSLIGTRYPYQFLDEGLIGSQFDSKEERLLIWTKGSIGIIDFQKQKSHTDQVFESGARLAWLYQSGEKIEQAFWVFDGSHILFRDKNKINLIELETHGKRNLYHLLNVKEKSSVYYHEDSGNLYYLKPDSGFLTVLELLPKQEILPLPFPERKEEPKKIEFGTS